MKKQIIDQLRGLESPAIFPELNIIPGFAGDVGIGLPSKNICYWNRLSLEASLTMLGLIEDGVIALLPVRPERYFNAGYCVPLPLAEGVHVYEGPVWLPVMILLEEKF